ncbi:MAG: protein of unknown function with transrane region [Candidatus Taylorbacteria bacterium]|nr:protein of unknown function with transrane region [Candidatus Taylorbacteria bacterium]
MENSADKSKIENLRNALYSRKIKIKPNFVLDLNGHKSEVKDNWDEEKKELTKSVDYIPADQPPKSFSKKVLWLAVIFFIVSLCVAGYVYFNGSNIISANNIKIEVVGPTTVKAGEDTSLDVSITNNNDTTLEVADLILEYPQGTRSATDSVTPMTHDRVAFDDIAPHTTVRRTIKSVLYGEEGATAHIDMTLEYRIPTAMSVFTKDTSYEVMIGSAPLTLSVDGLKEVNANQDYTLTLNVVSNSDQVVKDVLLTASLPFGYEVASTTPLPIPKTTVWNLGDIEANGKRTIVIKGKMYGDHNDEDRYFKISVGTKDAKVPTQVSGVISAVTQQVTIKEPFIGVLLSYERNSPAGVDYIARSGTTLSSNINLTNNLDVPIYDVEVESKITGPIVVPNTFKPNGGFYDSNLGVIRWNKSYDKNLENILPNNNIDEPYTFSLFKSSVAQSLKITHPVFTTDITVKAKRRLESGVPENIVSTIHKDIKVETDARFSAQVTHNTGPIENEGDLPPKVGKQTQYTVTWAITNTFNELGEAKVSAILPDYITWNNIVVGPGEKVTYNPDSRQVDWDVGGMNAQSNGKVALRQVSFQIGFIPSQSQVQTSPILVGVANFTARDTFTNTSLSGTNEVLTTQLPTDPLYTYDDSQVQPQ